MLIIHRTHVFRHFKFNNMNLSPFQILREMYYKKGRELDLWICKNYIYIYHSKKRIIFIYIWIIASNLSNSDKSIEYENELYEPIPSNSLELGYMSDCKLQTQMRIGRIVNQVTLVWPPYKPCLEIIALKINKEDNCFNMELCLRLLLNGFDQKTIV